MVKYSDDNEILIDLALIGSLEPVGGKCLVGGQGKIEATVQKYASSESEVEATFSSQANVRQIILKESSLKNRGKCYIFINSRASLHFHFLWVVSVKAWLANTPPKI